MGRKSTKVKEKPVLILTEDPFADSSPIVQAQPEVDTGDFFIAYWQHGNKSSKTMLLEQPTDEAHESAKTFSMEDDMVAVQLLAKRGTKNKYVASYMGGQLVHSVYCGAAICEYLRQFFYGYG